METTHKLRLAALGTLALGLVIGCQQALPHNDTSVQLTPVSLTHRAPDTSPASSLNHAPGSPRFRDVAQEAGLNYQWTIAGKRPLNILQTIGNGCAFLDYDNDGNLDVLLVGEHPALFKGDGKGHFTNVTAAVGLDTLHGHFLGCAVGDVDNDGYDDIYLSGYNTGVLLHNEQGRSLRDVSKTYGLKPQPWGTSCGFADLNGDGFLDLYVANYVDFNPKEDLVLCPYKGTLTGCGPNDYDARKGVVYLNQQGHGFRDASRQWHAQTAHGRGLAVAFADFTGSGRVGMAVANDLLEGDLFENVASGKFHNAGVGSGTALGPDGDKHAGMGLDWGDYDNDGKLDLFVTTFGGETKCLYRNEGEGIFTYQSEDARVDLPTLPYVAWGCKFLDADNDGWLDLLIANGHVQDNISRFEKKTSYRQPTLFLHNRGGLHPTFDDASASAGLSRLPAIVGRGLAVGDFDNDGRMDALVVNSEGKPLLLHNETPVAPEGWIGFHLTGNSRSGHDAYGAVVTLATTKQKLMRQCQPGGSYLSSSDARVHFGLGRERILSVSIRWPDGKTETLPAVQPGRYLSVQESKTP